MIPDRAVAILTLLGLPATERARLYDASGKLLADTDVIADRVLERSLKPAHRPGLELPFGLDNEARRAAERAESDVKRLKAAKKDLESAVRSAGRDVDELEVSGPRLGLGLGLGLGLEPRR